MKPTFSLSAAYVAPNVPATIVTTAAMAAMFHFFMFLLRVGQTGVSSYSPLEKPPTCEAPATRPQDSSAVRYENDTKRRRRGGPGSAARPRNQHENEDRGKIGQRIHHLLRDTEVQRL